VRDAAQYLDADDTTPELHADSVIENVNGDVDALVNDGLIHRVLAQVEVAFSTSLIEAWWRSLKSQWLYLNTLDSVAAVRRLTSFYVVEHNTKMPHAAFHGPDHLAEARRLARQARLAANRNLSCEACRVGPTPPDPSEPLPPKRGEPE
jgi:putative transposase